MRSREECLITITANRSRTKSYVDTEILSEIQIVCPNGLYLIFAVEVRGDQSNTSLLRIATYDEDNLLTKPFSLLVRDTILQILIFPTSLLLTCKSFPKQLDPLQLKQYCGGSDYRNIPTTKVG